MNVKSVVSTTELRIDLWSIIEYDIYKKILIYMKVGNPTFVYHQEELSNKNVVPEICFI